MNNIEKNDISAAVRCLKTAILQAQSAVAAEANRVMLMLYLGIGRFISLRTRQGTWGTGAIEAISRQLQTEMPGLRGFSAKNMRTMRQFYEEWERLLIWPPAAAKIVTTWEAEGSTKLQMREAVCPLQMEIVIDCAIQPPEAAKLSSEEFFAISFSHHIEILNKTSTLEERIFYIRATARNHWSKLMLRSQLATDAFHHTGCMPSNFPTAIPDARRAMKALAMFKDEYLLDFINTEELDITNPEDIDEPVIEHAIVANIRQFIMTLGRDFSFIGNQYHLEVMGQEQFIDLLFFNRELNCLVAVELKKGKFKSAYLGELNLYLQALDDQIRKPHENPSIGIILCKEADKLFVQYAIRDYQKPMGVATYRTAEEMPVAWRKALPSTEELQQRLAQAFDEDK